MKIIICEDNAVIAMELGWLLEDQGHTLCGIVGSSVKCMDRCVAIRPDLVLVDLDLEDGRTGLDLVEKLACLGIPLIIVSAEARAVPSNSSAKATIEKPFNENLLASTVAQVQRRLWHDRQGSEAAIGGSGGEIGPSLQKGGSAFA